jgi:hypothetical protein
VAVARGGEFEEKRRTAVKARGLDLVCMKHIPGRRGHVITAELDDELASEGSLAFGIDDLSD